VSGIKVRGRDVSLQEVLNYVGEGWYPLVTQLVEDLFNAGWDGDLHQIKEKFGGLRFYIGKGNDDIYRLIMDAESKSLEVCEVCGEPGRCSGWGRGWMRTLCEKHGEEYREEGFQ
jgi:hypothetical protein